MDGGSPKGADLALTADSAPDECLKVARYRLPHHTAVSFGSSDIRVFCLIESHLQFLTKHPRPEPHRHVGTMMPSRQTDDLQGRLPTRQGAMGEKRGRQRRG